jgi:hypothetical protein
MRRKRKIRTKLNDAPQATSTTLARPRSLMAVSCAFLMSFTGFVAGSQDAWEKKGIIEAKLKQ